MPAENTHSVRHVHASEQGRVPIARWGREPTPARAAAVATTGHCNANRCDVGTRQQMKQKAHKLEFLLV